MQTTRETNDLKKKIIEKLYKQYQSCPQGTDQIQWADMSYGSGGITCQLSQVKSLFCIIESAPKFSLATEGTALEFRLYFVSYENSSCFHVFIEESCQRSNVALALLRWLLKNKQESQRVH